MFCQRQSKQVSAMRRLLREEAGDTLIESGLSIAVMLLVIFGVMDFSRALYGYHFASSAARDATRYVMVRGSSWGSTACGSTFASSCAAGSSDIATYVKAIAPAGVSASNLTVNTTWTGQTAKGVACTTTGSLNDPGCVVSVQVIYAFNFVLPLLPKGTLQLGSTSKTVIAH